MIGISVKNFSIAFGNNEILNDISFDVQAGEIVTILGPSGCGKSTILRSIASLEDSYTGSIFLNETCLINGANKCNKDIGYIFQDYALFPHLNVKENIEFALFKLKANERQKRVDKLLKQFDLIEHKNKQIHELSGGQQQRVSIARVIAYEPKILLLDEPFSNLDSILRAKTKLWLKNLIKELGLSAILVTHDQKEALSMSDKIGIIHNKRIVQFDTPKNIYKNPNSFYIANFLGEVNTLPKFIAEDLNLDLEKTSIIRIHETKITNKANNYKLNTVNRLYCGEYEEVILSFEKELESQIKLRVYIDSDISLEEEIYLDINKDKIISVKN
ncbi:ABC transporter ATP-binding protein [Arcobacter sp. KX21116]|uniref:ABC transporter ATP-binding protein n=1 Tax=Arcobacter iocasae TaxID=2906515 RepID=UPI0035D436D9